MKPQRISAWRTYSSRYGRFSGHVRVSATKFSNVLKCHQMAVIVFALFATKNRASLFRNFRNLVVLAIKAEKFQGDLVERPAGRQEACINLSNIASTSARAPVKLRSRCAVSGLSQASSTNCRAAGASVSGPSALDPMTRRSA